jgi:acetyl esterase/lipase
LNVLRLISCKKTAANARAKLSALPESGFIVGGISSGANFAGVIAYTARDDALSPPITGLWVSIPVCLMPQAYGAAPPEWEHQLLSLEQNAENPLLTRKSLTDIQGMNTDSLLDEILTVTLIEIYGCPPEDTRMSFLLNKSHSKLPAKAYFQICGRDPLRDEAFLWQKLLEKHSSTKSKIHLYSGMPHGFWRFLHMKASQEWLDDLVQGIRYLCAQDEPDMFSELIVKE